MGSRVLTRTLTVALVVLASGLFATPARASSACAAGPGAVKLGRFMGAPEAGSLFYASAEGNPATATVQVTHGDCQGPVVSGQYTTEAGSAAQDQDYSHTTGSTPAMCDDVHRETYCPVGMPFQHEVQVPILDDSADVAAVESFTFRLTSGSMGVDPPSSAAVHVVDLDGPSRASLEPTVNGGGVVAYSRSESFARIKIPVFLAGPTVASVSYAITPSGAAPATLGEDYTVLSPNPAPVDADTRVGWIELGIVNDQIGEAAESVTLAIAPGGGIVADNPASTTFTILDNEESERPSSRFHHPRDNWRYKKSDYRIREVHVFATDTGGAGVVGSQLALRRNMKNGDCVWLTKEGWQKKDCSNRQWLAMTYDETGDLFYYRLSQLKSSVRTKIVDYTAFSRAVDGAENVETNFDKKRNDNTFEIKRTRRRR